MQNVKRTQGNQGNQGGVDVQDLLIILFKHKWKIIILGLLGLAGAVSLYLMQKPVYASHAKIFVRYLVEYSAIDSYETQQQAVGRYNTVMEAEKEILTSRDLAVAIADRVGVLELLPGIPDANIQDAAEVVVDGLEIVPSGASNVLHLFFSSPDPAVVQNALAITLEEYVIMHKRVHRDENALGYLTKKRALAKARLSKTDEGLNKLRSETGVTSFAERRAVLETIILEETQSLLEVQSEFDAAEAEVRVMEAELKKPVGGAEDGVERAIVPAREYRALLREQAGFEEQANLRALTYKESDATLRNLRGRIAEIKGKLGKMERSHPGLFAAVDRQISSSLTDFEYQRRKSQMNSSKLTLERLRISIQKLEDESAKLTELAPRIEELERAKEIDEALMRDIEKGWERAKVTEGLDSADAPNIEILQRPSPAARITDKTTRMVSLGLAGGGFAVGIGLAFLLELIINKGVRRPLQLETQLKIPLLLSIPRIPRLRGATGLLELRDEGSSEGLNGGGARALSVGPSVGEHAILPYTDAIRDRLLFHFELHDMRHKPKLVALTGLSEGAGTSTMAAGLAAAFAESDKARVLLVDMNAGSENASEVYNGRIEHTLERALEVSHQDAALDVEVEGENLYIAKVTPGRNADGNGTFAPRNLYDLMPDLRASEFDYIIFDMPPVGLTSPTVSMAGLMDKVLLVLDSENTDRDVLKRRYAELATGKAHVSCIYNKVKRHGPRWLEGDV